MANSNHQDAQARRQRQYELQRLLARYQHEYHTGKSPRLEEYIQRYPEFEAELIDFAFYFHTIAADLPEPGTTPAAQLSPAAEKALAHISAQLAPPFPGFFKQGLDAGYAPPGLAEALDISWDILAKLEARAIRVTSIPRSLIQRMADTLNALPESIAAYLRGSAPAPAGTFYYADQAPTQQQETFLEAIRSSPELSPDQKHEWEQIVEQEVTDA
jgi:hypothetical protein